MALRREGGTQLSVFCVISIGAQLFNIAFNMQASFPCSKWLGSRQSWRFHQVPPGHGAGTKPFGHLNPPAVVHVSYLFAVPNSRIETFMFTTQTADGRLYRYRMLHKRPFNCMLRLGMHLFTFTGPRMCQTYLVSDCTQCKTIPNLRLFPF